VGEGEGVTLLVVSPHLDDAVFACAGLIGERTGSAVVTVFAGVPEDPAPVTEWDEGCGFASSREAMLARRREDAQALAILGARPVWLDFFDAQYTRPTQVGRIELALLEQIERQRPRVLALPLGLFHSDHILASVAALTLVDEEREWLVYEDALYRRIPGASDARLGELQRRGFRLSPCRAKALADKKSRAVECYASQLRGLATPGRPGHADLEAPERYWTVAR
jgi:LmbE family N-acetylglucosaminyl deacetylase